MKTINTLTVCSLMLAGQAYADESAIPTGTLNVNRDMVRQGVTPELSWNIQYPSGLTEVITIDPVTEVITTKTCVRVQVCVIGVGITDQYGRQYPAESHLNFSSSGWQQIFTGRGRDVDPSRYYIDRIVSSGETLSFKAKMDYGSAPFYYNDTINVKVLKNGDNPPSVAAGYDHQTSAEEYLRPYLKDGKLSLGPMDIIYAAELTHSDPAHSGFDLQDTIVLVRFTKATCPDQMTGGHDNNGHGNNADGIDSSNPGSSADNWAEDGVYDTDYDGDGVVEDDEIRGGYGRDRRYNRGGYSGYYGYYRG